MSSETGENFPPETAHEVGSVEATSSTGFETSTPEVSEADIDYLQPDDGDEHSGDDTENPQANETVDPEQPDDGGAEGKKFETDGGESVDPRAADKMRLETHLAAEKNPDASSDDGKTWWQEGVNSANDVNDVPVSKDEVFFRFAKEDGDKSAYYAKMSELVDNGILDKDGNVIDKEKANDFLGRPAESSDNWTPQFARVAKDGVSAQVGTIAPTRETTADGEIVEHGGGATQVYIGDTSVLETTTNGEFSDGTDAKSEALKKHEPAERIDKEPETMSQEEKDAYMDALKDRIETGMPQRQGMREILAEHSHSVETSETETVDKPEPPPDGQGGTADGGASEASQLRGLSRTLAEHSEGYRTWSSAEVSNGDDKTNLEDATDGNALSPEQVARQHELDKLNEAQKEAQEGDADGEKTDEEKKNEAANLFAQMWRSRTR